MHCNLLAEEKERIAICKKLGFRVTASGDKLPLGEIDVITLPASRRSETPFYKNILPFQ